MKKASELVGRDALGDGHRLVELGQLAEQRRRPRRGPRNRAWATAAVGELARASTGFGNVGDLMFQSSYPRPQEGWNMQIKLALGGEKRAPKVPGHASQARRDGPSVLLVPIVAPACVAWGQDAHFGRAHIAHRTR